MQLSSLNSGLFSSLTSLQQLYVLSSRIEHTEFACNLSIISNRWLYNNQLTSLDSGLFSSLTSLQHLYVILTDYCNWQWSSTYTIPGILYYLYVQNRICIWATLHILMDYLHMYRELYNNKLTSLGTGLFSSLTSLQILYVNMHSRAHTYCGTTGNAYFGRLLCGARVWCRVCVFFI